MVRLTAVVFLISASISRASKKCPAQMKLKSFECDSTKESCTESRCCEKDQSMCGGLAQVTCKDANALQDSSKSTTKYSDPSVDCCKMKPKCSAYTCKQAYNKAKSPTPTTYCAALECTENECCTPDGDKCGPGYSCSNSDTFLSGANFGQTKSQANCCSPKGKCADFTSCPAGKKTTTTVCNTGTCDEATCCVNDNTKCNSGFTCGVGKHLKENSYGSAASVDNCCSDNQKCAAYSCKLNYYKKKTSPPTTCAAKNCDDNQCCAPDNTKCAPGYSSCESGYYYDSSKNGVTIANANSCCAAVGTCSSLTCPAGKKKKASPQPCVSNPCAESKCCEDDDTTCKVVGSGVTCLAPFWYKGTGKDGTLATAKNKDVVCCSKTATCAAGYPGEVVEGGSGSSGSGGGGASGSNNQGTASGVSQTSVFHLSSALLLLVARSCM